LKLAFLNPSTIPSIQPDIFLFKFTLLLTYTLNTPK